MITSTRSYKCFLEKKYKTFLINYKSGKTMKVKAEKIEGASNGGKLVRLEWAMGKTIPLFIGIDDIESIWVLK